MIKEPEKAFIIAFDKAINELGYDFGNAIGSGNVWSLLMIVYGKIDTKSRLCSARIYMQENGEITLRLFLAKIDAHRQYIENAPLHVKDAFIFAHGDCKECNINCSPKIYTIDGKLMRKCNHDTFYFNMPTLEKLPGYMGLLSKFYPIKKQLR